MKVRDARKNVDGAYEFETDYRAFEQKLLSGDYPHREAVRAMALMLGRCFDRTVLELMRDQGFDAFVSKVEAGTMLGGPDAARTEFSVDELRLIYGYILEVLKARNARTTLRSPEVH